jgi:hypothetical protein
MDTFILFIFFVPSVIYKNVAHKISLVPNIFNLKRIIGWFEPMEGWMVTVTEYEINFGG